MSSAKKNRDIPFWKTGRTGGIGPQGSRMPHIELYADLLQDPVFAGLTGSALKTYLGMLKEHGPRNDNIAFVFPRQVAKQYGISEDSLLRAIKELTQKGFIRCYENNANLRKPNLYVFSDDWKRGAPP